MRMNCDTRDGRLLQSNEVVSAFTSPHTGVQGMHSAVRLCSCGHAVNARGKRWDGS